jgi:hypothetical protein
MKGQPQLTEAQLKVRSDVRRIQGELRGLEMERRRLDAREMELTRELSAVCPHEEAEDNQKRCSFLDDISPCRTCPLCRLHLHSGVPRASS